MSPKAQKVRYPRSHRRSQSANSSQKAKRPSSEKQKMSRFASYTNSEQPCFLKYISIWYSAASQRCRWSAVWKRSVGLFLWDSIIPFTVAGRLWAGICQVANSYRSSGHIVGSRTLEELEAISWT